MKKKLMITVLILALLVTPACKITTVDQVTLTFDETIPYKITDQGDLVIDEQGVTSRLHIQALPDSHVLKDEHNRLLILSHPSDKYPHGILGDTLEATSVTLVDLSEEPKVDHVFFVPDPWVIESIHPLWFDWDQDGHREIVLTLSNATSGSKLVLYTESGEVLAESSPIGRGNRWRHALGLAALGEQGQMLLVDVKTPHIGGIVVYYQWDKQTNALIEVAQVSGYSTHDIGSRDMNMFTIINDQTIGQDILIIPTQSKTQLAALRLENNQVIEEWRLDLGGRLSSGLELIQVDGKQVIRAVVDQNRQVDLTLP